jgi:hypothetical protein
MSVNLKKIRRFNLLRLRTIFFCGIFLSLSSASYAAQELLHPGAERTGLYTSLETGQLFFTGNDRLNYRDGWLVGLKLGYDIWKYTGVEFVTKFSGHDSTVKGKAEGRPTSFFVYQFLGQLKGAYPLTQRFHLEGGVGGGIWHSNSSMLPNVGDASKGIFYGEMGCEYFFRTRGMSMGMNPSIGGVQDLKSAVIQLTAFLRYTF